MNTTHTWRDQTYLETYSIKAFIFLHMYYGNSFINCIFGSHSIIEASLVSRMWSVRIQGTDISIGNWMRRPIVSSRKNSRNQSWDKSQHCCSVSATHQTYVTDKTSQQAHNIDIWSNFACDVGRPKFNINSTSKVNVNLDVNWCCYLLFLGCVTKIQS